MTSSRPATLQAVERIERARAEIAKLSDPDARWLADSLADFIGAEGAMTLDQALGIKPDRGKRAWSKAQLLDARDQAIVEFYYEHFAEAGVSLMCEFVNRYQGAAWPAERGLPQAPLWRQGSLEAEAFEILKLGRFPGERQVRRILAKAEQRT